MSSFPNQTITYLQNLDGVFLIGWGLYVSVAILVLIGVCGVKVYELRHVLRFVRTREETPVYAGEDKKKDYHRDVYSLD